MSIENLEAEISILRAKLAEAERERDRYRAALDWLESATLADTWGLAALRFDNQRKRWEQVTLISDSETVVIATTLLDAVALAMAEESEATDGDE